MNFCCQTKFEELPEELQARLRQIVSRRAVRMGSERMWEAWRKRVESAGAKEGGNTIDREEIEKEETEKFGLDHPSAMIRIWA